MEGIGDDLDAVETDVSGFESLLPLIHSPLSLPPVSPDPSPHDDVCLQRKCVLSVTFLHSYDDFGEPLFGIRHLDPETTTSLYIARPSLFKSDVFRRFATVQRALGLAPGDKVAGYLSPKGPHAVLRYCETGQHGVAFPGFYYVMFGTKQQDGSFEEPSTALEFFLPLRDIDGSRLPDGTWKTVPFRHGVAIPVQNAMQLRIGEFKMTFSVTTFMT